MAQIEPASVYARATGRPGRGGGEGGAPARAPGPAERPAPAAATFAPIEGGDEDPLAPVRGKLGNDRTALLLANYFRARPRMALELPEGVWRLRRTHGFYLGDGRLARRVVLGWLPALVLYTVPTYPDGLPRYDPGAWRVVEPGLHRQPTLHREGFSVDLPFNRLGLTYVFVAFRADGAAL